MLRPTYPIDTARLRLRPYTADDLDALHAIQSRPDVMRYLYGEPRSREEVRDVLATRVRHPTIEREGDRLFLAMERRDSAAVIGDVSLHWLSAEHRQGEIGFVLHPDHHGRGYGREAAMEMLRLGFAEMGLHRIIGRCDARNEASARLMERLGMRREAHFRENEIFKGAWGDEYVYAMLAAEWAAHDGR
jgi:RimJ/RimL family protein N-acetyltransferase